MWILALSLFLAEPAPLDMPKARAYLVGESGIWRLEERYRKLDLWTSAVVRGRWIDGEDRVFTLLKLTLAPPAAGAEEYVTRTEYELTGVRPRKKDAKCVTDALDIVSPVPTAAEPSVPRQLPRGYERLEYWQGTNSAAVVSAFRPDGCEQWYIAIWTLAEGDDIAEMTEIFEKRFLLADVRDSASASAALDWKRPAGRRDRSGRSSRAKSPSLSERELFRRDVIASVANYPSWRFTDSPEFLIVDALGADSSFPSAVTNMMPELRRRFAETLPSPVNVTNSLSVARIYASREDYLSAVGADMAWSAAYWSVERRELVAHLGDGAEAGLLRTFRHEAFHQYLSYAASMISASPWLNEGYAQYFEYDGEMAPWMRDFLVSAESLEEAAKLLEPLVAMDYESFYAGTDDARALKYRLAWMTAYFIEKGARDVRHDPFRNLKRDYMECLVRSRDMRLATDSAFGGADRFALFVDEWRRFWLSR